MEDPPRELSKEWLLEEKQRYHREGKVSREFSEAVLVLTIKAVNTKAFSFSADDKQDLVQDTFLAFWKAYILHPSRICDYPKSVVYLAALNKSRDLFRKRDRRPESSLEEIFPADSSGKPVQWEERIGHAWGGADRKAALNECCECRESFLESLNERNRTLLRLYRHGESSKRIGAVLDMSENAVNIAKTRLKKEFETFCPDCPIEVLKL